jgi:hypothetical protein
MKRKILISLMIITSAILTWVVFANAQNAVCNTVNRVQESQIGDPNVNDDVNCQGKGFTYTKPSQATIDAEAAAQQSLVNSQAYKESNFNKDLFDAQLGQTILINNPALLTMVGALDRFIDFKNFQAIANTIVALFNAGELNSNEVDTFLGVMENQQINLETYNSDIVNEVTTNSTVNASN